jgi:hypothetical protein
VTAELEELRRDRKWPAKASNAIVNYWQNKTRFNFDRIDELISGCFFTQVKLA